MNTPDTECEGCKHNKKYPNEDVTHTCPSTPDTEWRTHAQRADYFEPDTLVMTLDNIDLLLTSRDTYWKERVRKDVKDAYEHAEIVRQRTLNEIRQAVEDDESYGGAKECVYKILDRY